MEPHGSHPLEGHEYREPSRSWCEGVTEIMRGRCAAEYDLGDVDIGGPVVLRCQRADGHEPPHRWRTHGDKYAEAEIVQWADLPWWTDADEFAGDPT